MGLLRIVHRSGPRQRLASIVARLLRGLLALLAAHLLLLLLCLACTPNPSAAAAARPASRRLGW